MSTYQSTMKEAMEIIADGTSLAMRRLLPEGTRGYVGAMNNWTGRYTLSDHYVAYHPGYLMGRLWLLHHHTHDEQFKKWALRVLDPMVQDLTDRPFSSQAVGLDIYYGLCWAAEMTGSTKLKDAVMRASDLVIKGLWSDKAQLFFIGRVRLAANIVNIDAAACFFHFPWAARYEPRFMDYWVKHNDSLLRIGLMRPDGSIYQVAYFDEAAHALLYYSTFQGYRPESTWARGQSWGMHNYTAAYESTGQQRFLDAAIRASDWWVKNVPSEWVPPYDFTDPARASLPKDSCAAAIAANSLIRLAEIRPELASRYRPVAEGTMIELAKNYLSEGGILLHGSIGNVKSQGTMGARFPQEDVIPFGNYYFVEALCRELSPGCNLLKLKP